MVDILHWLYVFLSGSYVMTKWVGCATLVNVVTGLLKDPITTAELAEFILFIVFIITAELAEFISGLKQYNPKIF